MVDLVQPFLLDNITVIFMITKKFFEKVTSVQKNLKEDSVRYA